MPLDTQSMMERRCIIYLPTLQKLDLTFHPKQLVKDLWEKVVSALNLKEDDYFGLRYKSAEEHYSWLQNDKRILDHDIEMKSTDFPLEFIFSVKFYEDSVTVHKHPSTVELIFLHAQNLLYDGEIYVPCDLSLELSAIALQAFYGDFSSEETAYANFKKLSCLPRSVIQELPSIEYCEEQVISWYKSLCGISRGQAVLFYMSKVEKLSNYGVHFFKVKDKGRVPWWLGICNKGIYQYKIDEKLTPHQVFQWRNLENLYFREKKFSVEVCAGHKRALSTGSTTAGEKSKKNGNNQTPKTYAWYGSAALIKSIWIMAIAQHRFYWDKKQSLKSKSQASKTNASNLRNAIDKNSNSLIVPPTEHRDNDIMQRKDNKKIKASTPTVGKKVPMKPPPEPLSPQVKALEQKMITDLKKRKLDLEDQLYDKVQELKEICKQEYNITEKLPIEYIRYMLPKEEPPALVKKQQTSFPVQLRHSSTANELQKLESECELLNQITKAASNLVYETSSKGRVKKTRLLSYQKSLKKLQDVENRIDELRKKQGQDAAVRQSTLIMNSDFDIMAAMKECSIDDKSERSSLSDGMMLEDETSVSSGAEALSTHSTPAILRPESGSADVDMNDVPIQRSRTPPPAKTKVAWLPSPRVKVKKHDQLSPSNSYPVHPSPTSYRSTTSHSSGAETPPNVNNREWAELRWQHPKHPDGWNVSSLDSLESIGSRKSNEHNIHGSPEKRKIGNGDISNANALRIARAAESRSNKVSLREKHREHEPSRRQGTVNPVVEIVQDTFPDNSKDSRTSLTDSGHGTDSRVQSCHEDDINRKRNGGHSIRRDISDSSLSELSTQSNPVVLPSSGHIPKFVPYFMTNRNRSATQAPPPSNDKTKENEHDHVRKRSSSFTESGSTLQKPTSRRDNANMRTLTRSRTHEDERPDSNDAVFGTLTNNKTRPGKDDVDSKNQSTFMNQGVSEIQTPIFDTNLNICRQYLSRSQGQLAQNNPTPTQSSEETTPSGTPYISVVDKPGAANPANAQRAVYNVSNNNSNIKMNFGQIYKFSEANQNYSRVNYRNNERVHTPHETGPSNNIPKCNSLDSVLDRNHANDGAHDNTTNYAVQQEYPVQYPSYHSPTKNTSKRPGQPPFQDERMPNHERDKYNNEAYDEIRGMAWVPSLDEYGSRASVAESLPAKSKREDIREMLQQHFAHHRTKRTPSSSSTSAVKNKQDRMLQARIRAMMKEQDLQNYPDSSLRPDSSANTWEGYKQNLTMKRPQNLGGRAGNAATKSEHTGVNIFAHKPPPPLRQQNQAHFVKTPASATGYSTGTVHKGYVTENTYIPVVPMATDERSQPVNHAMPSSRQQKSMQNLQSDRNFYQGKFQQRSLSETWKQQNLTGAANMQNHHTTAMVDHYQVHPMYRPMGHHGVDPRTSRQDHPRRTASADDLLWPSTDGRDQNANLNIRTQQGTLV